MLNLGSYNTGSTRTHVRFPFSTFARAGGNVAPSSAIDAADIRVYKAADGAAISATQRSSSAGITCTSPFDSLTGFHAVDIDLADNTDAGFYAAGSTYFVVLAPDDETIDSQTITGVALAMFEIGPPPVNVTQLGGSTTPVTNLNTIYNTDYATVYDTTNKAFLAKLGNFAMGGSSLALTTGAISGTTLTFSGAVAFQSTFAVSTSTSLGALSATTVTFSGAVAFQSTFAVTTSTSLGALSCTTLTASGAVAFQSTFAVTGTVTFNAFTVTNAMTVSGATTLTGAVTASNASNNIVGIDVAKISGDGPAADALEAILDTTGGVQVTIGSLIVTGGTSLGNTAGVGLTIQSSNPGSSALSVENLSGNTISVTGPVAFGSTFVITGNLTAANLTNARIGYLDNINNATLAAAVFPTDPADQSLVIVATDAIYSRIGAPAGASVSADIAAVKTDTGNLVTRITAALFSGITSMAQWLGLMAGKQTGNSTARTELRATGAGSGTYDETTDSQEALRDRGDTAWITATSVTVSDKTGFSLVSTGLDLVLVAGKTLPNAVKYIGAVTAGKISGAGTGTEVFLDFANATAVTVVVDSSGNRTSVTWA